MKMFKALLLAAALAVGLITAATTPASATVGATHYARATIHVYHATPNHVWEPYAVNREQYFKDIAASLSLHYKLVDGLCVKYYPCWRIEESNYGATGWQGTTLYPNFCGTNTFCNYTGAAGTYLTIKLNTYYPLPAGDLSKQILACHEEGHGLGLAHPASGTDQNTCMVPGVYTGNNRISNTEANQLKAKWTPIPYAYGPNGDVDDPTLAEMSDAGNSAVTGSGPAADEMPPAQP